MVYLFSSSVVQLRVSKDVLKLFIWMMFEHTQQYLTRLFLFLLAFFSFNHFICLQVYNHKNTTNNIFCCDSITRKELYTGSWTKDETRNERRVVDRTKQRSELIRCFTLTLSRC